MTWKIWTIAPALALAACAEEPATDATANLAEPAPPPANDAAPARGNGGDGGNGDGAVDGANGAGDADMAWNFSTAGRGPKLTYGEPQTDNVRLTLRCAGGDRIELSFLRGESGGERMNVRSGGASETVSGTVEDTELGPFFVSAELPASATPLQRFRGGSSLSVEYAGDTRTVPPAGPEADRFFSSC